MVLEYRDTPAPLAFQVGEQEAVNREADKEFRQGFETFIAPGLAYGHWRKHLPRGRCLSTI